MPKCGTLRTFSLRFTFLILGLTAIVPFTYFVAHYSNVPFHWLMPALYLSAGVMLFLDFHEKKRASLLRFGLRVCLTALAVFGVFPDMSIWAKLAAVVYMMIFLSIISYVISDKFSNVGALCFFMFMFNLSIALFFQKSPFMAEHGQIFSILLAISTFSILSYYMILNIDTSRRFGVDVIKIPRTTKCVMLVILAIFCLVVILLSVMPWIVETLETLLLIVRNLFSQFFGLFTLNADLSPDQIQETPAAPPLFSGVDEYEPLREPGLLYHIIMRLSMVVLVILMLTAFVLMLVKLTVLIIRLFNKDQQRKKANNEVFTETIEKVAPKRKDREKRRYFKRPRYSSLLTDRERVLYIYSEYIRRAKRIGLTHDNLNNTPNEVLDEITKNISKSSFPLPEYLSVIYNIARYSYPNTEITGVDELRRRLL